MTRRKPVPASLKPRGFDGTNEDSRRIEALIKPRDGTWSMLPAAAVCDRSLGNVTPLHVLALLCKYRNAKTGACFPSVGRIAKDLGITARSVQRHVEKLIGCGHIAVVPRRHPATGKQTSNDYYILFLEARGPADKQEAPETRDPTVDSAKTPGEPLITSALRVTLGVTPASLKATSNVAAVGPKRPGEGDAPSRGEGDASCRGEGDASCRGEGDASCREGVTPDVIQNYPTRTNQSNEPVAELDARARGAGALQDVVNDEDQTPQIFDELAERKGWPSARILTVPERQLAPSQPTPDPLAIELGHIARAIHMPRDEVYGAAVKLRDKLVSVGFEADAARSILADEARRIPKTWRALKALQERVAHHVQKGPRPRP
jgi:DNA-binding MarR family transcriptional regulator